MAGPDDTAIRPALDLQTPPLPGPGAPTVPKSEARQLTLLDDRLLTAGDGPPLARVFGLGVHTVVLDPGHGGIDPGAVAATGLREKTVTLAVARALAELLRDEAGLRVLLTRDGDETVPLARRVEIANAASADLFVSIHVNTLPNAQVNAIETYYFGTPIDNQALRLAELENSGSEMPIAAFRALVEKLGATLKRQESLALAQALQASLIDGGSEPVPGRTPSDRTFDGGVRVGPFVVLLGVDAPAVLTEVGCLSNRREALQLATPDYRARIAWSLATGIAAYTRTRTALPASHTAPHTDGAAQYEPSATEGAYRGQDSG